MLDFLKAYSLSEILIFLIMFAIAFKSVITFWDWFTDKMRKWFGKQNREECVHKQIEDGIADIKKEVARITDIQSNSLKKLNNIEDKIQLLTEADQADMKAWITEKHHYFCYERKWIDDYNLDCIEKRYHYYKLEGGNSFVADLMKEIRALPKVVPMK